MARGKLALGTVQFGRSYGVSNTRGQTPETEVEAILTRARGAGVAVLDTAPGYGDAEAVLGRVLAGDPHFRIITKTPALKDMAAGRTADVAVRETLEGSLARLKASSVAGLIVHLADDLLGPDGDRVWAAMERAKAQGLVAKIGTSAYTPDEVRALTDRYPIELVQIPYNVFDQRWHAGDLLSSLRQKRIEIHARSAFLQGLLLMDPARLPEGFSRVAAPLSSFRNVAAKAGLSPLALALRFVLAERLIDCAVLGVTRLAELEEILDAAEGALPSGFDPRPLAVNDDAVVIPSLWPPDGGKKWTFVYQTKDKSP